MIVIYTIHTIILSYEWEYRRYVAMTLNVNQTKVDPKKRGVKGVQQTASIMHPLLRGVAETMRNESRDSGGYETREARDWLCQTTYLVGSVGSAMTSTAQGAKHTMTGSQHTSNKCSGTTSSRVWAVSSHLLHCFSMIFDYAYSNSSMTVGAANHKSQITVWTVCISYLHVLLICIMLYWGWY